ncbi:MAG: hypothetical protein R3F43_02300 [bacterium]
MDASAPATSAGCWRQATPSASAGRGRRAGDLRLRGGDLAVLRVELRRYRLPAAERLPAPARPPAIEALERRGFDPLVARAALGDTAARRLVPGLVRRLPREWLGLLPELDGPARAHLARCLGEVRDADAAREALPDLLALLGEVIEDEIAVEILLELLGHLGASKPGGGASRIIDALRALPPTPAGRGQARWLALKRVGAVPGRADLAACLEDCDRSADPVGFSQALLCQAFQVVAPARDVPSSLLAAVRSDQPEALAALAALPARDPGARISSLIAAWPHAHPARRDQLLDVAEALQPLGTPRWIKGLPPSPPRLRVALEGTPRLASLLQTLRTGEPARRREAAVALLDWPDVPEGHEAVLEAWLAGAIEVPVDRQWLLADLLVAVPERLLDARGLELVEWLSLPRRRLLLDRLWRLWLDGVEGAEASLRRLGAAYLLPAVAAEVARGGLMAARLLSHGSLPQGPTLDAVLAALRHGGQGALAEEPPSAPGRDPSASPSRRRSRPRRRARAGSGGLIAAAQGPDASSARTALDALVKEPADDEVIALLQAPHHPPRSGSAHPGPARLLKRTAPREVYLEAALPFLDDPRPDVQRSVIRALAHARHPAALRRIIELLQHRHRTVRQAGRGGRSCTATTPSPRCAGPTAAPGPIAATCMASSSTPSSSAPAGAPTHPPGGPATGRLTRRPPAGHPAPP